jgi:hypothetical protein
VVVLTARAPSKLLLAAEVPRAAWLVAGSICCDDHGRAVEVSGSHLGIQLRPQVLIALAALLTRAGTP